MVWELFAVALLFGLLVSAALYFALLWPGREPTDTAPNTAPRAAPHAAAGASPRLADPAGSDSEIA